MGEDLCQRVLVPLDLPVVNTIPQEPGYCVQVAHRVQPRAIQTGVMSRGGGGGGGGGRGRGERCGTRVVISTSSVTRGPISPLRREVGVYRIGLQNGHRDPTQCQLILAGVLLRSSHPSPRPSTAHTATPTPCTVERQRLGHTPSNVPPAAAFPTAGGTLRQLLQTTPPMEGDALETTAGSVYPCRGATGGGVVAVGGRSKGIIHVGGRLFQ